MFGSLYQLELVTESLHDLLHRCKRRIARGRKGFVKTVSSDARLLRKLRHSACASDVAEGGRDEAGVPVVQCSILSAFSPGCAFTSGIKQPAATFLSFRKLSTSPQLLKPTSPSLPLKTP